MQVLYEAADRIEAQRLADFLGDHGICASVLGDYLAGAAGELPVNIYPTVWIAQSGQMPRACRLLEEFLQPGGGDGAPWTCPLCGETVEEGFEVCWNCGSVRPLNQD